MRVLSIDVETSRAPIFHPWQKEAFLCAVGTYSNELTPKTWLFNHSTEKIKNHRTMISQIQKEIDRHDIIVAHNLKFDIHWLWFLGLDLSGKTLWCTQVAEYMLNGQRDVGYGLDATAKRYSLGQKEDAVKKFWDEGYQTDEIPANILLSYLEQDCKLTLEIYQKQAPLIEKYQLNKIFPVNMDVLEILAGIEYRGFAFDVERATEIVEEKTKERDDLEKRMKELVGFQFSVSSGQQLSAAIYGGIIKEPSLFHYHRIYKSGKVSAQSRQDVREIQVQGLGIKPLKGTEAAREGFFKVDKDTIKQLKPRTKVQKEFLAALQEYSKVKKIIETFRSEKSDKKGLINQVQADGRVHPQFNMTVTRTGRLSSSSPNAQNLFKIIKYCIPPTQDEIVNVDLSQIEFRVAAALSQDECMMQEINEDIDTHGDNAEKFLGAVRGEEGFSSLRTIAKIITFRSLYGGSAYSFFMDPKMPDYSLKKWESLHEQYYKKYSGLAAWQDTNIATVTKQGFLRSPSGRILGFAKTRQKDGSFGYKKQQILNYPVQSGAADLMYLCMAVLTKRMKQAGFKAVPIMQVHDSLVFDAPTEEREALCKLAVKTFSELPELAAKEWGWEINIPLKGDCEVGPNYRDVKTYSYCIDCGVWDFAKENMLEVADDKYKCQTCYSKKDT